MHLIYNGKQLPEADFHVGSDNRAFTYGDGIFETIIGSEGKVNFLADHLERLSAGVKALAMNLPADLNISKVEKQVSDLLKANKIEKGARIKIIVWRTAGGLFTPSGKDSEYIITAAATTAPTLVKEKVLFYTDLKLSFSPYFQIQNP